MGKLFNNDSSFYRFATRIANIMILNVLWIICSIPIVTIGASTIAVYYVCLKMVKNEETNIVKAFFKSFKENFKQGTMLWLMIAIFSCILGASYYYLFAVSEANNTILKGVIILVTIIYVFSFLYVFPLLARYDNTIQKTIINSFMISIRYLDRTIKLVLILAALIAIGFYSKVALIFVILLGVGVVCYINTSIILKIFEGLDKLREEWEANNQNGQVEAEDNNEFDPDNLDDDNEIHSNPLYDDINNEV